MAVGLAENKVEIDCDTLYTKYNIHPLAKSIKGWTRVFSSVPKMHQLGLTECIDKNGNVKKILSDCVFEFLTDRESKFNQNLGGS